MKERPGVLAGDGWAVVVSGRVLWMRRSARFRPLEEAVIG